MKTTDKGQRQCYYHPHKKGDHVCSNCGKRICFNCVSVSFGNYVCEECDPDFGPMGGEESRPSQGSGQNGVAPTSKPSRPGPAFLKNPKVLKGILAVSFATLIGTVGLFIYLIKHPLPPGPISIYKVLDYQIKSEGKSIAQLLEEKEIVPEWGHLENQLTPDGGFFVFFDNPDSIGLKPVWYVDKTMAVFAVNKDSRDLSNSELSETRVFSQKGFSEQDIIGFVYSKKE